MVEKLTRLTSRHHYVESGLQNVWLEGVYLDDDGDPVIPNILQLHTEIAKRLALQKKRLSGAEVRFLRSHIGLSGDDFARKILKASAETVSQWESDKQAMGASTELLLRVMVLREVRFDDYEPSELADFAGTKQLKLEVKYSQRSKRWNVAA